MNVRGIMLFLVCPFPRQICIVCSFSEISPVALTTAVCASEIKPVTAAKILGQIPTRLCYLGWEYFARDMKSV